MLHVLSMSDHGPFTNLSKIKGIEVKNYSNFIGSGTDVSAGHMSPHTVCNQFVTSSLQLSPNTCKVPGITDSVISVLLATCIFWEMRSNQKHQSRYYNPPVDTLLYPYSHQSAFSVRK